MTHVEPGGFVYLFNYHYTTSNGWKISETWRQTSRAFFAFAWISWYKDDEEPRINLTEGRDLNQRAAEYKAGVLPTAVQHCCMSSPP